MKSREELRRVTLVTSCASKLLIAKLTTLGTIVNVLEVGNDHVPGSGSKIRICQFYTDVKVQYVMRIRDNSPGKISHKLTGSIN